MKDLDRLVFRIRIAQEEWYHVHNHIGQKDWAEFVVEYRQNVEELAKHGHDVSEFF